MEEIMEREKIKKILEKHKLWLQDDENGEKANLEDAYLYLLKNHSSQD